MGSPTNMIPTKVVFTNAVSTDVISTNAFSTNAVSTIAIHLLQFFTFTSIRSVNSGEYQVVSIYTNFA